MSLIQSWTRTVQKVIEILEYASDPGPTGEFFRQTILTSFDETFDEAAFEAALTSAQAFWKSSNVLLERWQAPENEPDLAGLIELLSNLDGMVSAVGALDVHLDPEAPGRLFGALISKVLVEEHPIFSILMTWSGLLDTNLIETPALYSSDVLPGFLPLGGEATFRFDRLVDLFQSPTKYLEEVKDRAFVKAASLETAERLVAPVLGRAFDVMGWQVETIPPALLPEDEPWLQVEQGNWAYELSTTLDPENSATDLALSVGICRHEAAFGALFQLEQPTLSLDYSNETWQVEATLSSAPNALAIGGFGVFFEDGVSDSTLKLVLRRLVDSAQPISIGVDGVLKLIFGEPRLEIEVQGPDEPALRLASVANVGIELGSKESDSFISSLFSSTDQAPVNVEVGVNWSPDRGLYLTGSGDLTLTLPIHLPESSPVQLNQTTLGLRLGTDDKPFGLELGTGISATLGPLLLQVERLGLRVVFNDDDVLGAAPDVEFMPPLGVGLAIETPAVSGGGYLYFNHDDSKYAGALALSMGALSLRALGLVTTKLPGGEDGFSMVVVITADFEPIQLGFGFTLNGVGGILGINRSVEVDVLRLGLKQGILDSVLLSDNVSAKTFLERAPQMLSVLDEVFPSARDQYLFGPIITLGWGTPTLITARLGVIIELPNPLRLILLGTIKVLLPVPEAPIVDLRLDVLGILEPTQKRVSIDASLYDSRIGVFGVSGDMAFRMRWGDDAMFLLSIGGFHPAYEVLEPLPELRRMSLSLGQGDDPRMALEAYLALTSNSVQMGARLELYASEFGYALRGKLGFDALVYFDPFAVLVDIFGKIALSKKGSTSKIMSVDISASLNGPGPWRVNGRAAFKVLGFEYELSFQKAFGQPADPEIPVVEIWPLLQASVSSPLSWASQLPNQRDGLTLEAPQEQSSVLVHPSSQLEMQQKVVPLELGIERFGSARPQSDDAYFKVVDLEVDGQPVGFKSVEGQFAPGEYLNLTDQEKLSRPAFESLGAGVLAQVQEGYAIGDMVTRNVAYERLVIDKQYIQPTPDLDLTLIWDSDVAVASVGKSAPHERHNHTSRYSDTSLGLTLRDPTFVTSQTDELTTVSSAETYVKRAQDDLPGPILRTYEVNA